MVSWFKMLPVAKIMFDHLNTILGSKTNKSDIGKITSSEIETLLKSQVNNIISVLGSAVDEEK